MPINSQFPTIGNSALTSKSNPTSIMSRGGLLPARVIDISLSTSTNGASIFQTSGEWANIGAIKFELLNSTNTKENFPQGPIAYPLDTNVRKVPLINEIVFIISGPSRDISLQENSDAIDFYYMNAVSLWGRSHLNMLPSNSSNYSKNTDTVSPSSVEKGIENNDNNQVQEPSPGRTFQEKANIRNLFPNEGDVIIEGRFGNSIRFGSTARQPSGSKDVESPWSTEGQNGNPITIIRNGQSQADLPFNNWYPIYEDIQNDDSSIYMTSGQTIPVALASTNFASFGIDAVPVANTTKLLQDVPLIDPDASPIESDDIENTYDIVNQEPDLSTEEVNKQETIEKVQRQIDNIKKLEKLEESSRTRSNTVREEQQIRDEFTIEGEEI